MVCYETHKCWFSIYKRMYSSPYQRLLVPKKVPTKKVAGVFCRCLSFNAEAPKVCENSIKEIKT